MPALSFLILIAVLLVIEGIHVEQVSIPHGYIYFAMAFSFGVELLNMPKKIKSSKPVEYYETRYRSVENNDTIWLIIFH